MKKFVSLLSLLLFLTQSALFGWGEDGHVIIAKAAFKAFPYQISGLSSFRDQVIEKCMLPDQRRNATPGEELRHYIDIDYYPEFRSGNMIREYDRLVAIHGDTVVKKIGIAPWAVIEVYRSLVEGFEKKDQDRIVTMMADLVHYVADLHNPMHTTLNYDGEMTGQKGIHHRFEGAMIKHHGSKIEKMIQDWSVKGTLISDPLEYIFDAITVSHSFLPVILEADKAGAQVSKGEYNDAYYEFLWERTNGLIKFSYMQAAEVYASLVYTAWTEAGRPEIK